MATVTRGTTAKLEELLGEDASNLLEHKCGTVPKSRLPLPGPDFVSRVWKDSDRSIQVLRNLQTLFDHGRLAGSGYLSILPVDQGIEHTAGASFAPNPIYFDGEKIVELAIEGGCNAVASTFGVLGSVARRYAHRIPFICKLNHNELLTYPTKYDQVLFGTVKEAWEMGAVAVGATVYFGSAESDRQLQEIAFAFHEAHELGLATVLWCYVRNSAFKKDGVNYETAADLTGQANLFFQAKDGIRDVAVTGVQTCALPISWSANLPPHSASHRTKRCHCCRGPWEARSWDDSRC